MAKNKGFPRTKLQEVPQPAAWEKEKMGFVESVEFLQERIASLELALEDVGWTRLIAEGANEFSREGIGTIATLSRLMYLKSPMIRRAVDVQADYVFSLGVEVTADHSMVREVIREFMDDPINKRVLTSETSFSDREVDLQLDGNLFIALFPSSLTGRVQVRFFPMDEIKDIISNPGDRYEPWFYLRSWSLASPAGAVQERKVLYPDWNYSPADKPPTYLGIEIDWGVPVYHMKVGGVGTMKFGVPEKYPCLDWAVAYKDFLSNWATIMKAYARMAAQISGLSTSKKMAAAKSKLATTVGINDPIERNPPANAASFFLAGKDVEIKPIRTAGSTTPAEDGRPLKLMVACGAGLPDTFFGDADVGNFATSQTLDRPTELRMVKRQKLWKEAIESIISFVIWNSARWGRLREQGAEATLSYDPDTGNGNRVMVMPLNTDPGQGRVGEPISATITAEFPEIIERSVVERVRAVTQAVTMNGRALSPVMQSMRYVARLTLRALGVKNIEEVLDTLYPDGDQKIPEPPVGTGPSGMAVTSNTGAE